MIHTNKADVGKLTEILLKQKPKHIEIIDIGKIKQIFYKIVIYLNRA